MKRLRLLSLMLMAIFAIGAAAATSALAVEPGVLTLAAVEKLEFKQEKNEAVKNVGKLVGAITVECKKLWVLPAVFNVGDKKHWTLAKDVDFHFSECAAAGVKCKSTKDTNGTILVLTDVHLVAFLVGAELVPGALFLVLGETELKAPLVLTCGLVKVEVTGVATARATPGAGEEPTTFSVTAEPGLKCDTSDTLCKEELEPNPLLAGGKAATETTEAQKMTFSTDVLWDF